MPEPVPDARSEQRARRLLASVAGHDALDMYEELGFIAVDGGDGYGYLIYPHRPIVAFDASSRELLSEYCVRFPDAGGRLPDADDVLAKWMALQGDEQGLISEANLDRLGRQLDPVMVRRDLGDADAWRQARAG